MEIFAQIIGIVAMCANVFSYQFKSKQGVLAAQLVGGALFAVNMFLLGVMMGGLLNILAVVRAVVYMHTERLGSKTGLVNAAFMVAYGLSYVLVFTLFGKELTPKNCIVELLPLIAMAVMTLGFSKTDAKAVRLCGFVSSPCWLIYNCINMSLGGILCEAVSLFSIISAYLRLDVRKEK